MFYFSFSPLAFSFFSHLAPLPSFLIPSQSSGDGGAEEQPHAGAEAHAGSGGEGSQVPRRALAAERRWLRRSGDGGQRSGGGARWQALRRQDHSTCRPHTPRQPRTVASAAGTSLHTRAQPLRCRLVRPWPPPLCRPHRRRVPRHPQAIDPASATARSRSSASPLSPLCEGMREEDKGAWWEKKENARGLNEK